VTEQPQEWTPAFPGQRPPFLPGHQYRWPSGNEVSLRHGAYSPRRVDPIATDILEQTLADPDVAYLKSARWRPALWSWAKAEAQCVLLDEYLAARGEEPGDGVGDLTDPRVLSAYALLHRAETRAASGRGRLGLDPLSASRLGRDKAAAALDVAQIMAQLHALEQEREREGNQ
jgi:hypothetical protein